MLNPHFTKQNGVMPYLLSNKSTSLLSPSVSLLDLIKDKLSQLLVKAAISVLRQSGGSKHDVGAAGLCLALSAHRQLGAPSEPSI